MRTVDIYRCQPTVPEKPVEPVTIRIHEEIPDFGRRENVDDMLDAAVHCYRDQGRALADALFSALPGGTMDELIARLFERRASLFRVSFAPREEVAT